MEKWLQKFAEANFQRSADTAHDLKTPLNVAVLNLELLRMRVAKLAEASGDEKIVAYAAAIEMELRRMARIFDAFFLLSTPPKGEGDPTLVDLAPILSEIGGLSGIEPAMMRTHPSRIRQALKMFFDGASKVLEEKDRRIAVERDGNRLAVDVSGRMVDPDLEPAKIFKFYYTDPSGNPDLSLASARLIAETYGGELLAVRDRDNVKLRLTLPLGDQ